MNARPTHIAPRTRRLLVLAAAVAVTTSLSTACSFSTGGSVTGTAEKLIEGKLAEDNDLGEVAATCDEPASKDVGASFDCTSTSDLGELRWTATIAEDDKVDVESVNLVTADGLDRLEEEAVRALEERVGAELGRENLECGDGAVALDEDNAVLCALTDPDSGDVYDATLTVSDTSTGEFDIEVADAPR